MTAATDTLLLVPALLSVADELATGQLSTSLPDGDPAQVYVNEGQVYGVVVRDGSRTLGERLVANGALSSADLELALEAQRSDVPGWRIGELLVHLGFVGPEQVQACLAEQMQEMLGWLLAQPPTPWHLRRGSRTRGEFAAPLDVVRLLAVLGVQLKSYAEPVATLTPMLPSNVALVNASEDLAVDDVLTMDRSDAMAALRALNTSEADGQDAPMDGSRRGFSFWRPSDSLSRSRPAKGKDKRTRGRRTR